jgi:hypothetical protein
MKSCLKDQCEGFMELVRRVSLSNEEGKWERKRGIQRESVRDPSKKDRQTEEAEIKSRTRGRWDRILVVTATGRINMMIDLPRDFFFFFFFF